MSLTSNIFLRFLEVGYVGESHLFWVLDMSVTLFSRRYMAIYSPISNVL